MDNGSDIEKLNSLSRDVISLSINKLMVNLRFMDSAMSRLEPFQHEGPISVDGVHFFYNPLQLLLSYKESRQKPTHAYLHGVLHCVFQHFYIGTLVERQCWSLASDIAVEAMINELDIDCVKTGVEEEQMPILKELEEKVGMLTAEKLYRHFLDGNEPEEVMKEWARIFEWDDHKIWYDGDGKGDDEDDFGEESPSSNNFGEHDDYEESLKENPENENAPNNKNADKQDAKGEWEDVAEQIKMDLDSFSKEKGDEMGTMMQNLKAVTREKYDYATFLKKFSVMGEAMKVNNDEFDYIFYTYGMNMYGKMPLIEPLEYKEVKKVKEFVIAIDTSGSVKGDLVQRFIQKTYNILMQQENFFSKINLHIIQCDTEIQEDVKIENKEQFDAYMDHMVLKGMGGTDFRPVFSYVDDMIRAKEFRNLKGLIYFTDGEGTFPVKQPKYDTAFVFVDDDYNEPEVPVWAIKLVLTS
ncbi:MAG: metallopeptidase, partial [Eubacterium sp.]|nr:metallopeptidase [Candidatus Colimonas fimequi]